MPEGESLGSSIYKVNTSAFKHCWTTLLSLSSGSCSLNISLVHPNARILQPMLEDYFSKCTNMRFWATMQLQTISVVVPYVNMCSCAFFSSPFTWTLKKIQNKLQRCQEHAKATGRNIIQTTQKCLPVKRWQRGCEGASLTLQDKFCFLVHMEAQRQFMKVFTWQEFFQNSVFSDLKHCLHVDERNNQKKSHFPKCPHGITV